MTLQLRRKRPITAPNTLQEATANSNRQAHVPRERADLEPAIPGVVRGLFMAAMIAVFNLPLGAAAGEVGEYANELKPRTPAAQAAPRTLPAEELRQARPIVIDAATRIEGHAAHADGSAPAPLHWRPASTARAAAASEASSAPAVPAPAAKTVHPAGKTAQGKIAHGELQLVSNDEPHAAAAPRSFPATRAAHLQAVHPLHDPFDDRPARVAQNGENGDDFGGDFRFNPPLDGDLPAADPALDDELDAPPALEPRDNRFQPLPDPQPRGNGFQPSRPAQPLLPTPIRPRREEEPCDDVYNDRNCCREARECRSALDYIRSNHISRISLDITPSIKPDEDDPAAVDAYRRDMLSRAESRTWRDRQGNVLARGRFEDYVRRQVVVRMDGGGVRRIPVQDLSDTDTCFVTAWWGLPAECNLGDPPFVPRDWVCTTFTWKASGLCHKPLLFEHVNLERYGHTTGPITQPFVSGAHFFGSLVTVPYQLGMTPPTECIYTLGHYRPGSCAPWLLPAVPISPRGAAVQTGVVAGGVFLLP